MMSTPADVVTKINEFLKGTTTWDEVKALVAETTFTHRDKPVYGEDDYTDVASWEDTIGLIFMLPTDKETELKRIAKFVYRRAASGKVNT